MERPAERKSHLVDGHLYEFYYSSPTKAAVTANLIRVLGEHARHRRWHLFSSSLRIALPGDNYIYPKASLTVDEPTGTHDDELANPALLAEVTCPATDAFVREVQWNLYQQLPSVKAYLIVDPFKTQVDFWSRHATGDWAFHSVNRGIARIKALDLDLPLADLFYDPLASVDDCYTSP